MSVGAVSGQSSSLQEYLESLREGTGRQAACVTPSADEGTSTVVSTASPQVAVAGDSDALRQLRDSLLSLLGEPSAGGSAGSDSASTAGLKAVLRQLGIDPQQFKQDLAAAKNGPPPAAPGPSDSMPSLPPGLVFDAMA